MINSVGCWLKVCTGCTSCTGFTPFAFLFTEKTAFEVQALDTHNRFRDIHNADSMKMNQDMCTEAQTYAEYLAKTGKFEHSKGGEDGENLAMKCLGPAEKEPSGSFASTLW